MNTTDFVQLVRSDGIIPDDDEDYSVADILALATQVLYERFGTAIGPSWRQGNYLLTLSGSFTVGNPFVRIPPRAIVNGLETYEVSVDNGVNWFQPSVLSTTEVPDYDGPNDVPRWFTYVGDSLQTVPAPNQAYRYRLKYYIRPSVLVTAQTALPVVGKTTTQVQVNGDPTTQLTGFTTFDVVNRTGGCEVVAAEVPFTGIVSLGGGNFGLNVPAGTDLNRIVTGSVQSIRKPDTTDFIPVPAELVNSVVCWTTAAYLLNKGDKDQAAEFFAKAEGTYKRVMDAVIPRTKARPPTFQTRNTFLRRRLGAFSRVR